MTRQNITPNPSIKEFEAYMDFSGGLNSETSNERLKDNEFPVLTNVDLSSRGSAKRRWGRRLVCSVPGVGQGKFFYYRDGQPKPDHVLAVSGQLYVLTWDGTSPFQVPISDGAGGTITFQTTDPIEAVQYGSYLFIATGTKFVELTYDNSPAWQASTAYTVGTTVKSGGNVYKCTTAGTSGTTAPTGTGSSITDGTVVWAYQFPEWHSEVVQPYQPTVMEAIYIGTNGLAADPNSYIQDGVDTTLTAVGIQPSLRSGVVNQNMTFTAYINKPTLITYVEYQWEVKKSNDTNWPGTPAQAFDSTKKTWTWTPDTATNFDIRVTARAPIANPSSALSLTASGSGSSLTATTTYVAIDFWNPNNQQTTTGSSQATITPAAGQNISFTVTLPANTSAIGVYVGTASGPKMLGKVSSTGQITYSGSSSTGLSATVNGSNVTITVSAVASATGATSSATNTTNNGVQYALTGFTVNQVNDQSMNTSRPVDGIQSCKKIILHWDRLILSGDSKHPYQVYISDLNNPRYFPVSNTISFDTGKQEAITSLVRYRDFLVVFTKTTIQTLTGKSPDDYQRSLIHDGIGCIADWTAQVTGNNITFLSAEGVMMLKPNQFILEVMNVQRVDYPIKTEIQQSLDPSACAMVYDSQYWLCFPQKKALYRLYYDQGMWVKDTSSKLNFMQMTHYGADVYDMTTDGKIYTMDKTLYNDDGEVYDMIVESKFLDLGSSFNYKKLKRIYILARHFDDNIDLKVTVQADSAIVMTPEDGEAIVGQDGYVTWQTTTTPNFHFYAGTVLGTWILGVTPLGDIQISVQLAHIRGRCRRTKVRIVHSQDTPCEVFGFGIEFKERKPY